MFNQNLETQQSDCRRSRRHEYVNSWLDAGWNWYFTHRASCQWQQGGWTNHTHIHTHTHREGSASSSLKCQVREGERPTLEDPRRIFSITFLQQRCLCSFVYIVHKDPCARASFSSIKSKVESAATLLVALAWSTATASFGGYCYH